VLQVCVMADPWQGSSFRAPVGGCAPCRLAARLRQRLRPGVVVETATKLQMPYDRIHEVRIRLEVLKAQRQSNTGSPLQRSHPRWRIVQSWSAHSMPT